MSRRAFILLETDDGPQCLAHEFDPNRRSEERRALELAMDTYPEFADPEGTARAWVLVIPDAATLPHPYLREPRVSPGDLRDARAAKRRPR